MLSKSAAKFIKSLQIKKHRQAEQMFTVEGEKSVLEVLHANYDIELLIATTDFLTSLQISRAITCYEVSQKQLEALGSFKSNRSALAVVKMKQTTYSGVKNIGFTLALDNINDPGNLGTIIRLADWYGINDIIASYDTTDRYSPKVISATKGSFTRVHVHYVDLATELETTTLPIYGATMEGASIHTTKFSKNGVLVMGSEANGISQPLLKHLDHRITIPKYGGAESLNVAMATGIIYDNIARCNDMP